MKYLEAAIILFKEDKQKGLYDDDEQVISFESLPSDERVLYLDEAKVYLNGESPIGLPNCLIEAGFKAKDLK